MLSGGMWKHLILAFAVYRDDLFSHFTRKAGTVIISVSQMRNVKCKRNCYLPEVFEPVLESRPHPPGHTLLRVLDVLPMCSPATASRFKEKTPVVFLGRTMDAACPGMEY